MSNAEEFLKKYDKSLIEKVGEQDWADKKVYDVDEVITFLQSHNNQALQELKERLEDLPFTEIEVMRRKEDKDGSFSGHRENTVVIELQDVIETIEDMQDE